MRIQVLSILVLIVCLCNTASAQPTDIDHGSFESVSHGLNQFYVYVAPFIHKVVTSSAVLTMSETLWKFFAVIMIVWEASMFSLRGIDFPDLFKVIFLIATTHVLMLQFDTLTTALWGWSEAFATGIQTAAIGIQDQFFAPRFIWNLITSFSWADMGSLLLHPVNLVLMIGLSLTSFIFSALAFIVSIWGLWGYSLAKMVGLMFIPTILFEKLSWLFDGWLRLFFGFLIYNVLAKAALMLVVIAMAAYSGLSPSTIPTGVAHQFTEHSYIEILSLFVFFLLSIYGLICTGKFAGTIVGGSQVCLNKAITSGAVKLAGLLK